MHPISIIILFLGGCIDSALLLMRKGATTRRISMIHHFVYPVVCAVNSFLAVSIGYVIATMIDTPAVVKLHHFITGLVLICLGCFILFQVSKQRVEERLDDTLTYGKVAVMSLVTNIDNILLSICMGLKGVPYGIVCLYCVVINYLASGIALEWGYHMGYQGKYLPVLGGSLLIGTGLYFSFLFAL